MSGNPFRIPSDAELFSPELRPDKRKDGITRTKRVTTFGERLDTDGNAGTAGRANVGGEENLNTYIAKKKEIFWVQMTLDIKKQEMAKLQGKTKQRSETLVEAQRLLDEDLARFDAFLIANDAKAMNALKAADELGKMKTEKTQREKVLAAEIGKVQDEISELNGQVENGRKLKQFLVNVLDHTQPGTAELTNNPQQLLEVFTGLEEQNLFLIQNLQESQEQLEEQQEFLAKVTEQMDAKIRTVQAANQHARDKITHETQSCVTLQDKIAKSGKNGSLAETLSQLAVAIKSLASSFGKEISEHQDPQEMLTGIERKFEEILKHIADAEGVAADAIGKLERSKEMDRREKLRAEKIQEQLAKNEARLKLSMLRAQAPIFKKTGKQLMFRSEPVRKEKVQVADDAEQRERAESLEVFGLFIDKDGHVLTHN